MSRKEFVIILSITFFVIMAWVIFDILHSKPTKDIDPKVQEILTPIDPNLDQATIDQINKNFSEIDQVPTFSPETTTTTTSTASTSATTQPNPTSAATDSATLDNDINNL